MEEALYPWCALLKKERDHRLWSQEELAEKIGSNARTVRGWELGETIPSKQLRRKLSELYQKRLEELCLDEETVQRAREAKAVQSEGENTSTQVSEVPDHQYVPVVITEIEREAVVLPQPFIAKPGQHPRFGDPFPEIWNVPRRHKAFFTGRDHTLQHLYESFLPDSHASSIYPHVLDGLGGVGKTQTAAEYAFRYRSNYQAIFWVKAATEGELLADYQTIAHLLKMPEQRLQERASLIQTMMEWFITHSEWLLILDNIDDVAQVEPFLPIAAQGHILLTTRAQSLGGLAQHIRVEPLGLEDGALCILRRAGLIPWNGMLSSSTTERVKAAQTLSQLMDGLPLALEQAGAYIEDTGCSIFRYLDLYQQELYRYRLLAIQGGPTPDYPTAVASAWTMSRRAVQSSHPGAADILKLCAFLASDAIPEQIVTKGAAALGTFQERAVIDPIDFDQALKVVLQYSLLNRDVDRDTISMHRIMQEVQQKEMDQEEQRIWAERTVRAVVLTLPYVEWRVMQPHIYLCLQHIERWQMTFHEAELLRREAEEHTEETYS